MNGYNNDITGPNTRGQRPPIENNLSDSEENDNQNSLSMDAQNKQFYDDLKKANQIGSIVTRGADNFSRGPQKMIDNTADQIKNTFRLPKGIEVAYPLDGAQRQEAFMNNDITQAARKIGSVNPFGGLNESKGGSLTNTNISGIVRGTYTTNKQGEQDLSTDLADWQTRNNMSVNANNLIMGVGKQAKGFSQQQLESYVSENPSQIPGYQQKKPKHKKDTDDSTVGLSKMIPWLLIGIIGLWVFVFMVSQISDYNSISIFQTNKLTDIITYHAKDTKMQISAATYSTGLGRNYISLLDFILFFFVTKCVYNFWLSEEYYLRGPFKHNLAVLLFLKDLVILVLSLVAGNYDSLGGWSGFGFFWLSTIGKLSIILTLQKIFFFRLNYFRIFFDEKDGCKGFLKSWGASLYQWGTRSKDGHPEGYIMLIIIALYLPLILHCIVGILESTYIVIIWIAVLFFLEQALSLIYELFQPRRLDKTLQQRLLDRQSVGIQDYVDRYWVYLIFMIVLIPGVASNSFACNFEKAIRFHFSGQQLSLNFFAIPLSNASFEDNLSFICNILSLF